MVASQMHCSCLGQERGLHISLTVLLLPGSSYLSKYLDLPCCVVHRACELETFSTAHSLLEWGSNHLIKASAVVLKPSKLQNREQTQFVV